MNNPRLHLPILLPLILLLVLVSEPALGSPTGPINRFHGFDTSVTSQEAAKGKILTIRNGASVHGCVTPSGHRVLKSSGECGIFDSIKKSGKFIALRELRTGQYCALEEPKGAFQCLETYSPADFMAIDYAHKPNGHRIQSSLKYVGFWQMDKSPTFTFHTEQGIADGDNQQIYGSRAGSGGQSFYLTLDTP
ncbi:MAG: hypothetical protein M1829_000003 [Trizodia sp. TS-e1964]|nr:MAG: hypothetical protein M1829_000003 [Trizodia sp. TS-e1964]